MYTDSSLLYKPIQFSYKYNDIAIVIMGTIAVGSVTNPGLSHIATFSHIATNSLSY